MFYVIDRPVPAYCVSKNDACPYKDVCEVYQAELNDPATSFEAFAGNCVNRRHPGCKIRTEQPQQDNPGLQLLADFREIVEARILEREKELDFYKRHNVPEMVERYKHDIFIYQWVIENIKKLEGND